MRESTKEKEEIKKKNTSQKSDSCWHIKSNRKFHISVFPKFLP